MQSEPVAHPLSLLRSKAWLENQRTKSPTAKPKTKPKSKTSRKTIPIQSIKPAKKFAGAYNKSKVHYEQVGLGILYDETVQILAMTLNADDESKWRKRTIENWGNDATVFAAARDFMASNCEKADLLQHKLDSKKRTKSASCKKNKNHALTKDPHHLEYFIGVKSPKKAATFKKTLLETQRKTFIDVETKRLNRKIEDSEKRQVKRIAKTKKLKRRAVRDFNWSRYIGAVRVQALFRGFIFRKAFVSMNEKLSSVSNQVFSTSSTNNHTIPDISGSHLKPNSGSFSATFIPDESDVSLRKLSSCESSDAFEFLNDTIKSASPFAKESFVDDIMIGVAYGATTPTPLPKCGKIFFDNFIPESFAQVTPSNQIEKSEQRSVESTEGFVLNSEIIEMASTKSQDASQYQNSIDDILKDFPNLEINASIDDIMNGVIYGATTPTPIAKSCNIFFTQMTPSNQIEKNEQRFVESSDELVSNNEIIDISSSNFQEESQHQKSIYDITKDFSILEANASIDDIMNGVIYGATTPTPLAKSCNMFFTNFIPGSIAGTSTQSDGSKSDQIADSKDVSIERSEENILSDFSIEGSIYGMLSETNSENGSMYQGCY